jgi:hypothetical protein
MTPLLLALALISSREVITRTPMDVHGKPSFAYVYQQREYGECPAVVTWTPRGGYQRVTTYYLGNVTLEVAGDTQRHTVEQESGDTTIRTVLTYPGAVVETHILTTGTTKQTELIVGKGTIERYYNARGLVSTVRELDASGALIHKHSVTYDSYGNPTSDLMIDPAGNGVVRLGWVYTYGADGWASRKESRTYYDGGKVVTRDAWTDTRRVE